LNIIKYFSQSIGGNFPHKSLIPHPENDPEKVDFPDYITHCQNNQTSSSNNITNNGSNSLKLDTASAIEPYFRSINLDFNENTSNRWKIIGQDGIKPSGF